jgi:hypothetical protein
LSPGGSAVFWLATGYRCTFSQAGRPTDDGFSVGLVAAVAVNHYARGWVRRLRLGLLRARGVAAGAEAGVLYSTRTMPVKGLSHIFYTVGAAWTDPATGVRWYGERRYHFTLFSLGLSRHARRFAAAMDYGTPIRVYYPVGKPARFLIDIPFSPMMSDFFLASAEPSEPAKASRDPVVVRRKALQHRNRRRTPPHPAR